MYRDERHEAEAEAALQKSRGRRMLRALYASASLRAAVTMAFGGVAFAVGSLVLARIMPPHEYGLVLLFIGVVAVCGFSAPLGFDLVVGRRGLRLDPPWRRATLAACAVVGVVTAAVAAPAYHLALPLAICVLIATVATGAIQACAAYFQGQRQFAAAVPILQLSNWALPAVAVASALLGLQSAVGPCCLITVAAVAGASATWFRVIRRERTPRPQPRPGELVGEALSLVTLQSASSIFLQLERLLLAPTVGVHALAMYGVLAVLVGSPYRMLQQAAQFTLIPSLRAAADAGERMQLLGRELMLVSLTGAAGSLAIWVAAPRIAHGFLGGHYDLSPALVAVGLVGGALKVCSAFALGTVMALGEERSLRTLSVISWASLALSVLAAIAAIPWGLVGVLYGISLGWLVRVVAAAWIALSCVRRGPAPQALAGNASRSMVGHG